MGCASSQPEPEPTPPPASQMRRRASAAAQGGIDPSKIVVNLATLPKIQKSDAALARIKECVSSNILCKHLAKEYKDAVIAAMKEVKLAKGEQVIKQGDLGDFWYIVDSGTLDVYKKPEGETVSKKVNSYKVGDSFGELALMFNQRRAADVIATSDCTVWAVDQATFQSVLKTSAQKNAQKYS